MSAQPAGIGNEVLFELHGDHIAIVTLNRPEKRNAINGAITSAMDWVVKETERNTSIRVVILTSSNDKTFCAGADLAEISAGNSASLATPDGGFGGFVDSVRSKPWIAAVRGSALAGGCEFSLACDMIVASDDSRFGLPEVKRGLVAAAGGIHRIVRTLPRNIALELVATGDPLGVDQAAAFGLVNRVVPLEDVLAAAISLAEAITVNAPISVQESLKIARLAQEETDHALRVKSLAASDFIMTTEDFQEGPRAFLEKRAPVWKGR